MFKNLHGGYIDYALDIQEKRKSVQLERIMATVANFNELEFTNYEKISNQQKMSSIIKKADNNTFSLIYNESIVPNHWKYILAPILKTISNKRVLKKIKKKNKIKYKECFNDKNSTLEHYKWFVEIYNGILKHYSNVGKILTNEIEFNNIWSFSLDDTLEHTYTKYCLNL
jgi:hypothetical protein